MTTQVVILLAAGSLAASLARLKSATTEFFNRLLGRGLGRAARLRHLKDTE